MTDLKFANWDHRSAVLVDGKAYAVVRKGGPWVAVDRDDVYHTAGAMTESHWRLYFMREGFGRLDVSQWRPGQDNEPQPKPLPRAKDFDDAARAAYAAHNAHNADQAYRIALAVLAAPATSSLPHIEHLP
jgi:hypothetical protein